MHGKFIRGMLVVTLLQWGIPPVQADEIAVLPADATLVETGFSLAAMETTAGAEDFLMEGNSAVAAAMEFAAAVGPPIVGPPAADIGAKIGIAITSPPPPAAPPFVPPTASPPVVPPVPSLQPPIVLPAPIPAPLVVTPVISAPPQLSGPVVSTPPVLTIPPAFFPPPPPPLPPAPPPPPENFTPMPEDGFIDLGEDGDAPPPAEAIDLRDDAADEVDVTIPDDEPIDPEFEMDPDDKPIDPEFEPEQDPNCPEPVEPAVDKDGNILPVPVPTEIV